MNLSEGGEGVGKPQTGVHRSVGVAMLRMDDVASARTYWTKNRRFEKQNGNGLNYTLFVLIDILRYRKQLGDEHRIANLTEYTVSALEKNAAYEGRRAVEARAALAQAEAAGQPEPEGMAQTLLEADYRMNQFLMEFAARGQQVQELALQQGLLPAIHHR